MRILSNKRRNAATAVTAAAVLALSTACSSSSGSTAAPAATGSASGTITWFANQFGPTSTDVRKTLIAAFEKAYPNIKVNLEQAPSDSDTYRSTLITQISGGSSSFDVYNGDVVWPAQFGKQGLALPLNSYFDSSYWNTFSNGLVTSLTYKGSTYAVPLFTDNAFLFYRKDLLAKAHLPVPTTWEQLQSEAETLQKDNLVKYGFAAQFDSYEGLTCDFTEFAADAGGSTVSSDGTKATIDSPADTKALTYMRGLITSGVSPSAITTFQEQQSESLFTAGQVAFLRNWTYAYADSNGSTSKVAGDVGVVNLPSFAGQSSPGYSVTGGWNLYVNPHSKYLAADVDFLKWMTGTEAQTIIAEQGGEIPTVASVLQNSAVQATNPAFPVAAKNKLNARPSFVAQYSQVSEAIYNNVNAALSGSTSPSAALSAASSQIDTALQSNGL
ncbi:ABC transporter substrate-binding protein [Actinospica sp. MGRD01-02]|uniref:ABC transporter substrate-binding protein n=1 Tax=Actinospica acidithermotolerans TaxID=2828514 RepID=A0A941IKU6_9ACTN|nr:ABC transporter substrate-binding protein [Actinospica acidithermotolerans]MBR7830999.1 ABC transporter substrate-binding protein [Actinospica acidithermotolerans]